MQFVLPNEPDCLHALQCYAILDTPPEPAFDRITTLAVRLPRTLHADPRTVHIPVIVLSTDATPSPVDRLLADGAAAYITKPLDVHHFLQVLDATLQCEVP